MICFDRAIISCGSDMLLFCIIKIYPEKNVLEQTFIFPMATACMLIILLPVTG